MASVVAATKICVRGQTQQQQARSSSGSDAAPGIPPPPLLLPISLAPNALPFTARSSLNAEGKGMRFADREKLRSFFLAPPISEQVRLID